MKSAEKVKTELDALKFFGWILPWDYVVGGLAFALLMALACTIAQMLIGGTEAFLLASFLLSTGLMMLEGWAVWLLFRANYFVLQLAAMVKLLPDMAARIALPYLRDTIEKQQEEPLPKISVAWPILRQLGWAGTFDYVIAGVIAILAVLAIMLACLDQLLWAVRALMATNVFFAFWAVQLGFRCGWFVLQIMADLKLLPQSTARLVLLFSRVNL